MTESVAPSRSPPRRSARIRAAANIRKILRAPAPRWSDAPVIDKITPFPDHPLFIEAMIDRTRAALAEVPHGRLVFTAHSIPIAMVHASPYVEQLKSACCAVAAGVGRSEWKLVYQSRSGPPSQPWLETGYLRLPARDSFRCRGRSHRVSVRSHGSTLRSGHGGSRGCGRIGRRDVARTALSKRIRR